MSDEENVEMRMLMPFVVVTSKGGPYADDAYVAGYEMGRLDAALEAKPHEHMTTIRTENVPQADLVGLRYGYQLAAETSEDVPEWSFVTFRRMAIPDAPTEETETDE